MAIDTIHSSFIMNIFLKKDLVSPITDKKTNPGSKLRVVGEIKEIPVILASGGMSTRYDLMIESNYLEPIQEDFTEIVISKKEIKEIEALSQDPKVFEKLAQSIAPTIFGHEKVKEALKQDEKAIALLECGASFNVLTTLSI